MRWESVFSRKTELTLVFMAAMRCLSSRLGASRYLCSNSSLNFASSTVGLFLCLLVPHSEDDWIWL